MSTVKEEKQKVIDGLKEKLSKCNLTVATDYKGFSVSEITDLRKRLRQINGEFKIAKNTLIKHAIKETNLKELEQFLKGPTALLISYGEATECAKILSNFTKEIEKGQIKGGIFEGKLLSKENFKVIASLPSREVLLGQIAGLLVANTQSIAGTFESLIRDIALLCEEVAKKNADKQAA